MMQKKKKPQNREEGQALSPAAERGYVEQRSSSLNLEAPGFNIFDLSRVTPGSTGLDLAVVKDDLLSRIDETQFVDTCLQGPLPDGLVGLIIDRSSNY